MAYWSRKNKLTYKETEKYEDQLNFTYNNRVIQGKHRNDLK
jgi:hypothetical protein